MMGKKRYQTPTNLFSRIDTNKKKSNLCLFVYKICRSKLHYLSAQAMLVSILMITAIVLAIGLAVASLGSGQINMTVASRQASQAYALSEGCLENALMRLARTDTTLPPSFTTPLGSCIIEITGNAPYEITSKATVGRANRILKATVLVNNEVLTISSWGEVY